MCQTSHSSSSEVWRCSRCGFDNPSAVAPCEMCASSRTPQAPTPAGRGGSPPQPRAANVDPSWACHRCSFKNPANELKCQMCDTTRPPTPAPPVAVGAIPQGSASTGPQRLQSASGRSWQCPQCSFLNAADMPYCEVCASSTSYEGLTPRWHSGHREAPPSGPTSPRPSIARSGSGTTSLHVEQLESVARSQLADINAFCVATGECFVDPSFTPNPTSLFRDPSTKRQKSALKSGRMPSQGQMNGGWVAALLGNLGAGSGVRATPTQWLRPQAIRTGAKLVQDPRWHVFNGTHAQGGLGNCWFLCALAVLAERPRLLKSILGEQQYNPHGAYLVRICVGGDWRMVLVDDILPCTQDATLAYARAARNQLWVPLIEKAFAKLHGCYEKIESGTVDEALTALTGWPCEELYLQRRTRSQGEVEEVDMEMLWARILSSHNAGLLMCASCGHVEGVPEHAYEAAGLLSSHAYSILGVHSVGGGAHRLLRLRNPWGRFEWRGDWSDQSSRWTRQLKEEVGGQAVGDDGVFFMALDDVARFFCSITVCLHRPGWAETRATGLLPLPSSAAVDAFQLSAFQVTQSLVSVSQQAERLLESADYLADIGVLVLQLPPGVDPCREAACEKLCVAASARRDLKPVVSADAWLHPSDGEAQPTYLAIPLAYNMPSSECAARSSSAARVSLQVYSQHPVLLSPRSVPAALLRQGLILQIKQSSSPSLYKEGELAIYVATGGGCMVYVENRSFSCFVNLSIDVSEMFNLGASRGLTSNGLVRTNDILPPRHCQIVAILAERPGGYRYQIAYQMSWTRTIAPNVPMHTPEVLQQGIHQPVVLGP
ncbi:hypothetical protein CYMTET_46313 [Cymbomonas tetramitiformis]|uniref:Calpain-15 n=1 Tax=Cymbomonas tetramitiformis TaxID=36881 RepID=A0AAE0BY76_9CHLO|nr:hypothetical protein CYMTET_46313 [Cymbomonas tetramitiformis]